MAEGEKIIQINITDEMKSAYIDYSMSVIVSRALPDVRDGFKPVHRRVLYGMLDLGVLSNRAHKKSARIVGEVLGKYHPHGDSSVYDTMVRMSQSWSRMRPRKSLSCIEYSFIAVQCTWPCHCEGCYLFHRPQCEGVPRLHRLGSPCRF